MPTLMLSCYNVVLIYESPLELAVKLITASYCKVLLSLYSLSLPIYALVVTIATTTLLQLLPFVFVSNLSKIDMNRETLPYICFMLMLEYVQSLVNLVKTEELKNVSFLPTSSNIYLKVYFRVSVT